MFRKHKFTSDKTCKRCAQTHAWALKANPIFILKREPMVEETWVCNPSSPLKVVLMAGG